LPAALRAIGAALGEFVCVRGALFGVELREEIERRKQLLIMAVVAAALLHMAVLLLTFAVAVAFWDTHRVAALFVMAALYLAFGAAAVLRIRFAAASSPPAFAATRDELARDLEQLRPSP
jgi:uncharacterized membrane protein YqjE